MGSRGGWGGRGKVQRRFFIEFSLIFIEFPLIFIDFLWFGEAREAGGGWRRLEAAWRSLGEPGGGWGLENIGFSFVFICFLKFLGGAEEEKTTTTTKKIKVIGTEGVGARPAWGEPGSLGAKELGSWGACVVCV